MAGTPYEFVLSSSSNDQPNSGSYGPFKVSTQATMDKTFTPVYDFNGAFGYVQTGPAIAAAGEFTASSVAYDKGDEPKTFEINNETLYSNYILVNNNVTILFYLVLIFL
jgi:hypothetical protein